MTYEPRVKKILNPACTLLLASGLALVLTACGTPSAKDFGGRWKPVNKYDDKVVEIPLAVPYTYYAAPMDGTLKTMLTRWTADTGMKLSYKLRSDFSLPKTTAAIHTTEVRDATSQLSAIYAAQGVAIIVDGSQLIVEEVSAIAPPAAPNGSMPTAAVSKSNAGNVAATPDSK